MAQNLQAPELYRKKQRAQWGLPWAGAQAFTVTQVLRATNRVSEPSF